MAKLWITELPKANGAWVVTPLEITELTDLAEDAQTAQDKTAADKGSMTLNAKAREAFTALARAMRALHKRKFFSPPMEDSDWRRLGLPPRDTIRTPIPNPTGQAVAEVSYPGVHMLQLKLKPLTGTLINPRADHGYRIYHGIMPTGGASAEEAAGAMRYLSKAAVTGEELPHSQFSRRRRVVMEFSAADSGKTVFFSIRFENAKGDKGPWGPVFSAVIP
jgi:hypothetical protein